MERTGTERPLWRRYLEQADPLVAAEVLIFLFVGVFFFWPLYEAVQAGLTAEGRFSFYWLGRLFSNRIVLGQIANSFLLACVTTALCLVLTMPMAIVSTRYQFRGQGILTGLLLVPLILPPFVGALSIKRYLGQFGILNLVLERLGVLDLSSGRPPDWLGSGFWVVTVLQTLNLFPILYLNLSAALANLDPAYAQAARNLGAGKWTVFRRITLPLLRPGIFAGGSIVFIWSFTDIGTPLMVGYEELASVRIFKELARADVSGRTYSLVLVMLVLSVLFYVLGKVVFGRSSGAESAKASTASAGQRLGFWGTLGAWVFFGGVILLAILPHIGVVLTAVSGQWIKTILPERYTLDHLLFVLRQPEPRRAVLNSLVYAGLSTTLDLVIGSAAAWMLVRRRLRGARVLDLCLMLPLAVPGVILAAGYIAMTAPGRLLEAIGPMRNPTMLLVIAYTIRRAPFVVRGVTAGLQQIPETLEQAARNLGATAGQAIRRITVPLIAANLIASGLLTFSYAMLEVSDSLVLAQLRVHYPITKEIYTQAYSANTDAMQIAASLGLLGMLVLGGSLAAAAVLMGKRLGAVFRA
ncbi:MAG TPA: iron ABC transporter permease [Anaerohalosphaeraceae bacterium]|nr:iron ABC transporter permease [Anaerohalosphaeraceae bacterium]HOL88014.1 iron ABC transporter permease [Anaerohalosphaeraceae bacterium]HPP55513.1 iron ABC transporter permease [Anaerohalosphaeraceae bacterium]